MKVRSMASPSAPRTSSTSPALGPGSAARPGSPPTSRRWRRRSRSSGGSMPAPISPARPTPTSWPTASPERTCTTAPPSTRGRPNAYPAALPTARRRLSPPASSTSPSAPTAGLGPPPGELLRHLRHAPDGGWRAAGRGHPLRPSLRRHRLVRARCARAGVGGFPQISMPMAEFEGLPLGLSLNGPQGADMQLLRLARRLIPEEAV